MGINKQDDYVPLFKAVEPDALPEYVASIFA